MIKADVPRCGTDSIHFSGKWGSSKGENKNARPELMSLLQCRQNTKLSLFFEGIMLRKLVIIFDKQNEEFIRRTYQQDLQNVQRELAVHGVNIVWSFVRQEEDENSGNEVPTEEISMDESSIDDVLAPETLMDCLYLVDHPAYLDILKLWGYYAVALVHKANQDAKFRNARYIIEGLDGLEYDYLNQVYQRLAGLPWDILETKHLKVRESTLEDVGDFYRIYKEPSITYYMENLFEDPDQERAYIKDYIRYVYNLYGYGMWTVILKENGAVIGRAGISIRDGYDVPELGFVIEAAHQRKGYATEVCGAILGYANEELQMECVRALVCAANEASIKVLSRLGFAYCKDVTEEGKTFQLWMKHLR